MSFNYTNLNIYAPENPNDEFDHKVYQLTPTQYRSQEYKMSDRAAAESIELLSQGVVVANMPDEHTGSGGYCYLLNLPALLPPWVNPSNPPPQPPKAPKLTPKELLIAVNKLITRVHPAQQSDRIINDLRTFLKEHGVP